MRSRSSSGLTLDIALACHKCGTTMSELHDNQLQPQERGLLDGTNPDGAQTKLWMTNCRHIVCYKHLPDGLVPFFFENGHPTVCCPICPSKHETPLFWIRGTDKWQHDGSIPHECFTEISGYISKKSHSQIFALEVHYHGALAAAKLYSLQSEVATGLLHKAEKQIETLEQENLMLKANLKSKTIQGRLMSSRGLLQQSMDYNSSAIVPPLPDNRLTLKRSYPSSLMATPRNVRQCLPERGTLQIYGIAQSTFTPLQRSELQDESIICVSPAFSTPYLRTNLSPMKKGRPLGSSNSIVRYGDRV